MRPIPKDRQTRDTLWTMIATPTIWALHFLFCYGLAAYVCAPNDRLFETIGGVRVAIGGVTVLALALIGLIGRRAYRERRFGEGTFPHDSNTPEDQERFLEFSSILLAILSFIAVAYTALPALLITDCR